MQSVKEFDKWYMNFLVTNDRLPTFMEAYRSRQPEIDALVKEIREFTSERVKLEEEQDALKAEVLRLQQKNQSLQDAINITWQG